MKYECLMLGVFLTLVGIIIGMCCFSLNCIASYFLGVGILTVMLLAGISLVVNGMMMEEE